MYVIKPTNVFKRDFRRIKKRGKDLAKIKKIMLLLAAGEALPVKNRDHILAGNYLSKRECHIEPDWLLIYTIDEDNKEIIFERTGSHSDLF